MQVMLIGCGQIGGSLLLRVRLLMPGARLCVADVPQMRAQIEASGAVDQWASDFSSAVAAADVVIVATPMALSASTLVQVLDALRADAVVFDVMSLKRGMHAAVRGHAREGRFVGGHPMIGSEGNGFSSANPAWLEDAPFILTRTAHTEVEAFARVQDFVRALGAQVHERTPEAHDAAVAAVSHLPQALASALMALTAELPDALPLHGPGFRDMTRLAASAPSFWAEVFAKNADKLVPLVRRYTDTLHALIDDSGRALMQARDAKCALPRLAQGTLVSRVSESSTGAMLKHVVSLAESGRTIYPLHLGEPKLQPSAEVSALVQGAMREAPIVYTPTLGASALRHQIAAIASSVLARHTVVEETIVTVGAKQALHLALACLLAPGDEVIVLLPAWGSFAETVRLAGGKAVFAAATPEAVAAVVGPRTRAIIINSPNNPTGRVYDRAMLTALLAPCSRVGAWLISDELYRCLSFEMPHVSAASLYDEERSVWLDGIAKSHAMTGLRIGYAVAPRPLIHKMATLASHQTSCASSVCQAAALALLTRFPHGDPTLLAELRARRAQVQAWVGDRPLLAAPLAGAFYAWLDVRAWTQGGITPSARSVCARLLEETGVATMFGEAFGTPGFLRAAYALSEPQLAAALQAIDTTFAPARMTQAATD